MVDRHVSMSEVARRLGLTLSAVSNWRRRHPLFPSPALVDGEELFPVDEMAVWLDGRRISKNDLRPDELPGTAYGTRFRAAMSLERSSDDAIEALWRDLDRLRGAEDVAAFADIALRLLYLALSEEDRWNKVLASDGARLEDVLAIAHAPWFLLLRPDLASLVRDLRGQRRLGAMVRLIERVRRSGRGLDVFDLLLDRFAEEEGRRDAAVHTPRAVVRLLVELAAPAAGARVFDPCCGSGEFLLGAANYLAAHGALVPDASFTGYVLSARSLSLAHMNLRLHGVKGSVHTAGGPAFLHAEEPSAGPRFDVVVTNPPFDLRVEREFRGPYGPLPRNRTSFAWLQHALSSLTEHGRAAVVMPGGTLFREGAERHVRAAMVDAGVVDAIIALPPQLFVSTGVPVTVWLLEPSRKGREEILFVDARGLGHMLSRTQRTLSDEDRSRIVDAVTSWRDGNGYADVVGFSASVPVESVREQDYVLVPGRYVGADVEVDTAAGTVGALLDELARLERRAEEVNAVVERRLDGIRTWTR